MAEINYKHLRYFWMVGKTGSIARASEQLFITPQSISGQISELEGSLGVVLLRKLGRGLELTDIGRQVFNYADEIFSIGNDLAAFIENKNHGKKNIFRLGISDCISRTIASSVIEPILSLDKSIHLTCKAGKLTNLLSDLSVHRVDAVIADRQMPDCLNVRAYNHHLGSSPLGVFGTKGLIAAHDDAAFPQLLNHANFLMPGEDFMIKNKLIQWFEKHKIHPNIVAEFDDTGMLKLFGQRGDGFFVAPHAIADNICSQYNVEAVGVIDAVEEHLYAITTERRIKHPAMVSIMHSTNDLLKNEQS